MILRHFLALKLTASLALHAASPGPTVVGVVVEAYRGHVNSSIVSDGATIYDGDRLSTEPGGALRLRGEAATMDLAEDSIALVGRAESGVPSTEAELVRGTLTFSSGHAGNLEIVALEARVSPSQEARTVAQVRLTGPKELCIYVRRGSLQFFYRGEAETIGEGEAYRVILDPPEDELPKKKAAKAAHVRKAFLFVAIGGAAVGGGIKAYEDHENHRHKHESEDRP